MEKIQYINHIINYVSSKQYVIALAEKERQKEKEEEQDFWQIRLR